MKNKIRLNVGANCVRPKTDKGITIIALVITIIIMLILVAVTISIVVKGGLFDYAGKASGDTKNVIADENNVLQTIKVGDQTLEEYMNGLQPDDVWDGESIDVPELKEFNWYIYNCEQLYFFKEFVNNGNSLTSEQERIVIEKGYNPEDVVITADTTVYLMKNLDLGGKQKDGILEEGANSWDVIGNNNSNYFIGSFNGNNHYIKGLYIKNENIKNSSTGFGTGFFSKVTGKVENLIITDSYIETYYRGGTIVGRLDGSIENCHVINTNIKSWETVTQTATTGGLVGISFGTKIENCSFDGNIFNNEEGVNIHGVGGICGTQVAGEINKIDEFMKQFSQAIQFLGGKIGDVGVSIDMPQQSRVSSAMRQ